MPEGTTTPPFSSLPLAKDGPHGNAWGRFGSTDQLGMLNLLTPATTLQATQEIKHGIRVSTDCALNRFATPFFARQGLHQRIHLKSPRTVNDDILTFNTQCSSQWDGFRHYGYQEEKLYFNGRDQDCISNTTENGTHAWVESGGIVGRGVLLDYARWATANGTPPTPQSVTSTTPIPLSTLLAIAESQNLTFQKGDILLIRTGFLSQFPLLPRDVMTAHIAKPNPEAIGVESCEEVLKWIWDTGFSAVGGDQPSFEAWPCVDKRYWFHEWLLAGWGMPIGELFDLERLSEECERVGKWSFFFSSVPLYVPGGVASPPNGVAIL